MEPDKPKTAPPDEPAETPAAANPDTDVDALETAEPAPVAGADGQPDAPTTGTPSPKKPGGIKGRLQRFNLYLLLFVFVLVVAGVIIVIGYFQGKKNTNTSIASTSLSQSTLSQLANSDASVGDPKQVLNVESNAVFAGNVLVRQTLEVAGGLQVGGSVTFGGITVSGQSNLDQVQINKNLTVAGDGSIQGGLTVQKGIQVNGAGTFNGALSATQVTTSVFQLNGDLVLTHHIVAGGPTPSRSGGPALGSGGTASVNGSDTSGAVTINTGGGPAAGCFVTVNFSSKYAATPHIVITPIGVSAGTINYYVDRTTSSFSICDASAPPAGSSFGFDYFVVE